MKRLLFVSLLSLLPAPGALALSAANEGRRDQLEDELAESKKEEKRLGAEVAKCRAEMSRGTSDATASRERLGEFRRRHPNSSHWTPEDQDEYARLEDDLRAAEARHSGAVSCDGIVNEWARAKDTVKQVKKRIERLEQEAAEKDDDQNMAVLGNAACPMASDNLHRLAGKGASWKKDGRVSASGAHVVSQSSDGPKQKFTLEAPALPIAPPSRDPLRTDLELTYGENGRLESMRESQKQGEHEYSQKLDFQWPGGNCTLDRVTVKSPDLAGKQGVSFDRELCEQLDKKNMLFGTLARDCQNMDKMIAAQIQRFSDRLGEERTFAVFTTAPDGSTKLKPFSSKESHATGLAIASDCAFHLKKKGYAHQQEHSGWEGIADDVRRATPAH